MSEQIKEVPSSWTPILGPEMIGRAISRMSYEILEKTEDISNLALVGIRTGGEYIGKRIHSRIEEICGHKVPFGVIDITLYRDDLSHTSTEPVLKGTELPFSVNGARIVLVDDILYTGRTVRASLDAIIDFGRPERVEFAVLVDRGHRELPIRADYVGKNIPTRKDEFVRLKLNECGYKDGVYLISSEKAVN